MFCQTCNKPIYNDPTCKCYGDEIRDLGKFMKKQKVKNVYFDIDSELKDVLVITTNKKKFYIGIQCSIYRDIVYPSITLNESKILTEKQYNRSKKPTLTDKDYGLNYISPFHASHRLQSKQISASFQESSTNIHNIIGAFINHFSIKKDRLYKDVLILHTKKYDYHITLRSTITLYDGTYCPISTNHSKLLKTLIQ